MSKKAIFDQELAKLREIFADVEESKRKLVEGLMEDAAFLKAENYVLKELIDKSGMVKIHPEHPEMQKSLETSKQYLKNANTYSVIIKTLNSVLNKNILEDDEDMSEFE